MNIEALCAPPPGSACPQPEPNATELPSSPRPPEVDAGLWTCRPPRPRPRRHAEHLAGLQIVRLRALAHRRAPSSPGCRPRRAAEENFARRRAADHAALRALAHVQRAYEEAVRVVLKVCALARRRAPSPAGARPHPPARALACRRAHVAGLQTSPRCRRELRTSPGCRPRRASRPRTRYKGLMKRPLACVSTVLLGTSHILRSILRRILRHVLHVQRGRRRACVGPEVSRRWKT